MPSMQVIQQEKPLPQLQKQKINPLQIAALAITAIALSILAHPAIGIAFLAVEGTALYTGSKAITWCTITTLTLLITTLSLSVLFPPATLITAPLTLLAATVTVIFTTTLFVIKGLNNPNGHI